MEKEKHTDHQHLLIKQMMRQIRTSELDFRKLIRQMNVDYYELDEEKRRLLLQKLIKNVKQTPQGGLLIQNLKSQLQQKIEDVNFSATRKKTYLIDCFRQASTFPITQERQIRSFNLQQLYAKDIGRQLRRVIWSRMFNCDRFRMAFSNIDRQVTPFKVQDQLKISLQKVSMQHQVTLKENQLDIALRIVEYFIKTQGRLPQKYHFQLAVMCVDLYSFTQMSKVVDVGAVSLGLVQLLQYYNEQTELRLTHLTKVIQIVDSETFSFINQHFLSVTDPVKSNRDLLQSFELFRLTAGSYFLNIQISQFIVDQLIIRRKCKLDIYTMFAIMILIISDEFEEKSLSEASLKDIILRARDIVKKQDFIEAYNVIYADIPPFYSTNNLAQHPNNRLLAQMIALQRTEQEQDNQNEDNFVIPLNTPARIGQRQ